MNEFRVYAQESAYASPWPLSVRIKLLLWEVCWAILCSWTPKPLNRWRLFWVRAFGASMTGTPFIHGRASIIRPWNLTIHDRACLGDGAVAYCLDSIVMHEGSTVAQGGYLCTGTHDFDQPHAPLKTAAISVGHGAFIGLRAIVMPGVNIGPSSIIGAGAVVTRDTAEAGIYGGNPARRIGTRQTSRTVE